MPVPVFLVAAAGLATAAVAATLADAPAPSVLVAVITVPFALYAALVAPTLAVPLALASLGPAFGSVSGAEVWVTVGRLGQCSGVL